MVPGGGSIPPPGTHAGNNPRETIIMTTKPGPAQLTVLRVLARHDGVHHDKVGLAAMVGPNGSARYGAETIDRCARRGWVRLESDPDHRGRTVVVLTDEGRRLWNETTALPDQD
jgi:hypothetical protein